MQSLVTVFGLLLIVPVHARVSENFKGCTEFFYRNSWPVIWGGDHVEICQTYIDQKSQDKSYFATLYDTNNRIPVYSAYVFENSNNHPEMNWCVEPQLVQSDLSSRMMRSDDLLKEYKKIKCADIEKVQAVYEDYQTPLQNLYNRGHLNPKGHHGGLASQATYTLTNVVPQNKVLNSGAWSTYETDLRTNFIKTKCSKVFVLTGAIPSTNPQNWIKRNNKNRVNIPSYLWNAYCCLDNNEKPILSGGATAENIDTEVVTRSLEELKQFFKDINRGNTELFKDNCK